MIKIFTKQLFLKRIFIVLLCLTLPCALSSFSEDTSKDENTVKALFVYNFTKHIEWPASKMTGSKFIITIYGSSPVSIKLNALLRDRKILDRNVEIRESTSQDDLLNSHIIFIPKGTTEKLVNIIEKCDGKSALIITEEKKMPSRGVSINIYEKENHLRFELSEQAIRKEGLKVSNQLYELASSAR